MSDGSPAGDRDLPKVYKVPIWDPSLPAFASGAAYVYGMLDDMARFIDVRRRHACAHDEMGDGLVDAYDAWVASGMEDVPIISVAYGEFPLVSECRIVDGPVTVSVSDYDETYMNIWGFPYEVHIDSATHEMMIVEDGDCLVLVQRTDAKGMTFDSEGAGSIPVSSSWGEPGIVEFGEDDGTLSTTMFLVNSLYYGEDDAVDALRRDEPPSVAALMGQIVADG